MERPLNHNMITLVRKTPLLHIRSRRMGVMSPQPEEEFLTSGMDFGSGGGSGAVELAEGRTNLDL